MSDFCKGCSESLFGEDFGDLKGLCDEDEIARVLCEGCGWITVDYRGVKQKEVTPKTQ